MSAFEVTDIIAMARAIPTPLPRKPLHEYGEVIHILLHQKRMTYRSIAEWFSERGLEYTPSHCSNVYAKWCTLKGFKQIRLE